MEIYTPRSLIHSSKGCTYKLCKKKKVATASGYVNMYMWMFLLQKKTTYIVVILCAFPLSRIKPLIILITFSKPTHTLRKSLHHIHSSRKVKFDIKNGSLACLLFLFKLKIEIHIFYVNSIWYIVTSIFSVQEINKKKP